MNVVPPKPGSAPPVYRPQFGTPNAGSAGASPVYRPSGPLTAQRATKPAGCTAPPVYKPSGNVINRMAAPRVYRPMPVSVSQNRTVQMTPLRSAVIQRDHLDTGLKKDEAAERFAAKAKARFTGARNPMGSTKQWGTLTNQQRGDKLLKYANAELKNTHVPLLKSVTLNPAAAQPSFQLGTWTIELAGDMGRTDDPYLSWLVDAVYHESRHCEQWFRIARKLAGDGQTAAQIAVAMGIQADIATAAVARPLAAQSSASKFFHSANYNARQTVKLQEATDWHTSIYGAGAAHRYNVMTAVPRDFPAYQALPEEVDAYIVGPKAAAAYAAL